MFILILEIIKKYLKINTKSQPTFIKYCEHKHHNPIVEI